MLGQRNNLLAGLLVVASIIAIVAGVIFLGGGIDFLGKKSYRVRFQLEEGVSGLKTGAEVHVGGVPVGSVKDVTLERTGGEVSGIIVTVAIDGDIRLRTDAEPYLVLPLLGSQGIINFPFIGRADPLPPDSVLEGNIAPPGFLAQAGYGDEEKDKIKGIIDNFSEIGEKFNVVGTKTNDVLDDVRPVTGDVREKWTRWSDNVGRTLERAPSIAEKAEGRLDQIEGVINDNRENLREGIESFKSTAAQTDEFMTRLREELYDIAKGMIEEGQVAAKRAREIADEVDRFIDEQRPGLRRTLGNLRLGSDQLRDTLLEVRRAPWRLVHRPDLRELNYELLYDSARSYAGAVGDLRAAAESLESLMGSGRDQHPLSDATIEEIAVQLRDAYANFDAAESAFMEQLMKGADAGAR